MKMPSSSAQDRPIQVWFQRIQNGEIKLPRFQRHQAWDKNRICSLLDTVTKNLPLGVTLLLNVNEEQFVSRYLATAPETSVRVTEHLLDGQQRLTALWRTLQNNYTDATYFLYLPLFDQYKDHKNQTNPKFGMSAVGSIKTMPKCHCGLISLKAALTVGSFLCSYLDQEISHQKSMSGLIPH